MAEDGGTKNPVVAEAVVVNTQPQAQTIPTTVDELLAGDGAMVKQLTNECCRCFVCQPNIHWTLHPYWGEAVNFDDIPGATMWIQEEAAYCDRVWSFWAPGCRNSFSHIHKYRAFDKLVGRRFVR